METGYNLIIKDIEDKIKEVELKGLTNSQDFLNWLDLINKLSVRY